MWVSTMISKSFTIIFLHQNSTGGMENVKLEEIICWNEPLVCGEKMTQSLFCLLDNCKKENVYMTDIDW